MMTLLKFYKLISEAVEWRKKNIFTIIFVWGIW